MSESNGHGGAREGAGRKPKAEEQRLIDKLSPYDDRVIQRLVKGAEGGDPVFVRMFMEYRFGKAKQVLEATVEGGVLLNGLRPIENTPVLNGNGHEGG